MPSATCSGLNRTGRQPANEAFITRRERIELPWIPDCEESIEAGTDGKQRIGPHLVRLVDDPEVPFAHREGPLRGWGHNDLAVGKVVKVASPPNSLVVAAGCTSA